jgi:FixJ family two-component response regulator
MVEESNNVAPDEVCTVNIVDDDSAVLESVALLLKTQGLNPKTYLRAEDFLLNYDPNQCGCLLLDINMPGMDGLDLQSQLAAAGTNIPIIFLTGRAKVVSAVKALKAGAFEFLEKPYDSDVLLDCIQRALEFDRQNRRGWLERQSVLQRIDNLTPRETEVLRHILDGKPNKVIASELKLSQRTVEIYRSNVMQKMQVKSLAKLVKIVGSVFPPTSSTS